MYSSPVFTKRSIVMIESPSHPPPAYQQHFGQVLLALPGQYLKVITHPSVGTFVQEKQRGTWSIVWFQLLMLGAINALLVVLTFLLTPPDVSTIARSSVINPQTVRTTLLLTTAILTFLLTPVSFFLSGGILYLIVRLFRGHGTYLQQVSVTLLFGVPMVILSALLSLIPVANTWLPWLPHIYSVVLLILAIIAVHYQKET
jgi:hypothetical protein